VWYDIKAFEIPSVFLWYGRGLMPKDIKSDSPLPAAHLLSPSAQSAALFIPVRAEC
jgi:hypothetical protein